MTIAVDGNFDYNMTTGSLIFINVGDVNLQSNITAVNTSLIDRFNTYNYNMTIAVDGNFDYNMSDGSYNSTYETWAYNQSTPYDTFNYNMSTPYDTFNYNMSDGVGTGNSSFNQSWTDDLYVGNNSAGWTLNISKLWTGMFYTVANSFEWTVTDDGSDVVVDFSSIGGTNSLFLETAGTFLEMIANPGPSNDYEMFAFEETQGADTAINFYEGGSGHNRIWDSGSMRIGGGKSSLCSNLTTDVDCISGTYGMGADLVVADDIWAGGKIFASDWSNISGIGIFNETYDALNSTYNKFWYNMSIPYDTYNYNMTVAVDGNFDYNMTTGSLIFINAGDVNLQSNITAVNTSLIDRFETFNYNMTIAVDGNFDYNMSDGSYNSTYETWSYNQSTPYDTFNYNMTIAVDGNFDYNMSDGSYNITYDALNSTYNKFWYNQSTPYDTYNYNMTIAVDGNFDYNMSDGSYNITYDALNSTYNKFWYNQSTPYDTYNYNMTIAVDGNFDYNMSDGSYNITYDALNSTYNKFWYNQSTPYDTYNYNMTIAVDGNFDYNMSDGSYNITYDALNSTYNKFWYNQSTPYDTYNYNMTIAVDGNFDYNMSTPYDDFNYNMSGHWDNMNTINATQMQDNDGTLTIILSWLTEFINGLLGTASDNLQLNITAVNTSLIDRFETFNYNMTIAVDGNFDYNMSDGSYNSTYETWSYNQSTPYDDFNYNMSSPYDTYNYNMSHPSGTDFVVGGNLTLGQQITFAFSEIIDNIVNGWITITGSLNVTNNLEVVGNATIEGNLNMTHSNITGVDYTHYAYGGFSYDNGSALIFGHT